MPQLHRRKADANHYQICEELTELGASVVDLHAIGIEGVPDILVGYKGKDYLVEIKTKNGKLSKGQLEFAEKWRGSPIIVITATEDFLAMVEKFFGKHYI